MMWPTNRSPRDAWARYGRSFIAAEYSAQTPDAHWYLLRIRTPGVGAHTTRWFPAEDVRLDREVTPAVRERKKHNGKKIEPDQARAS